MYADPSGRFLLTTLWLLIIAGAVMYAVSGATQAYESAKSLGYEGGELFGYTLSGLLVGDYLVVKDNWDTISKDIIFEDYNFDFSENPYYSFWTAGLYAKELMRKYTPDMKRTTIGIYLELQTHYIFYLFGNSHATDGAYMGAAKWNADRNAIFFELVASIFSIFSIRLKDLQGKLKFY